MLIMWQMALSISQILAAGVNRGVEKYTDSFGWRFTTSFQMLFPLLIIIFMFWVPESPRWLLRKGRRDKAMAALTLIHRDDKSYDTAAAQDEAQILQAGLDAEMSKSAEGAWSDLIFNPIERRKLLFSAGALIAQQINGIQWFYYFGTSFSKDIGLQDPFLMTIIVFAIQLFVVTAAMLLEVRIPRRPLMITCSCIMMFSIFMVGCMGIPNPGTTVEPKYGKVIITFVIVEICAANFSWGPLGWSMSSEYAVGPNRNRIFAVAVVCFWVSLLGACACARAMQNSGCLCKTALQDCADKKKQLSIWITVFTLPYLYYDANLGAKTGFVYTGLCIYTVGYAYLCVGEVRGRTIEEIEGFFRDVSTSVSHYSVVALYMVVILYVDSAGPTHMREWSSNLYALSINSTRLTRSLLCQKIPAKKWKDVPRLQLQDDGVKGFENADKLEVEVKHM